MAYYSLVASSTLFLGPVVYGFYLGHRLLPVVSILTTTASVSYWLDPTSIEKRGVDLLVSKTAGVICVLYGWYNIVSPSTWIRKFDKYAHNISNVMSIVSIEIRDTLSYYVSLYCKFHKVDDYSFDLTIQVKC